MDLNTVNKLWDAAEAENKANENKVINYVKDINALVNANVEIHVRPNLESKRDRTVYIEFVKPDGKEAFGADINFRVSQDYSFKTGEYGEVEFSMGCSTMGRVSRAEAPYQVCRCYLMAELWKREQETIKLFDTLTYDAYKAASKAQQEYDREQREIERAAEQKLAAEINAKIKVGYEFSESWKYRDTVDQSIQGGVTYDLIPSTEPEEIYLRSEDICSFNDIGVLLFGIPDLDKKELTLDTLLSGEDYYLLYVIEFTKLRDHLVLIILLCCQRDSDT